MYHKAMIGSVTIGMYGSAIGTFQRYDLGLHFTRFALEIGRYMTDGFKIMIKNRWVEQMPLADDRKKLADQRTDFIV